MVNANDWEYKVKSTPRKASVKDSAIDPNNPYVNKNLDADLSTVIGKHKNNRKQINTEQFLIKDKEKEKSDRQKNSDNDSTQDRSKSDRVAGAQKKKSPSKSQFTSNSNKK